MAGSEFAFDSAGTAAYHVGNPPDSRMRTLFQSRGISIDDLRARQVQAQDFHDFDFVIAMDHHNFKDLQRIQPDHSRAQLLRMMDYAPEFGLQSVPDPYYGDESDFVQVYEILQVALTNFFDAIRGSKG